MPVRLLTSKTWAHKTFNWLIGGFLTVAVIALVLGVVHILQARDQALIAQLLAFEQEKILTELPPGSHLKEADLDNPALKLITVYYSDSTSKVTASYKATFQPDTAHCGSSSPAASTSLPVSTDKGKYQVTLDFMTPDAPQRYHYQFKTGCTLASTSLRVEFKSWEQLLEEEEDVGD